LGLSSIGYVPHRKGLRWLHGFDTYPLGGFHRRLTDKGGNLQVLLVGGFDNDCLFCRAETHIDDIAERILQLGGQPDPHFSTYLKVAKVKEQCPKCVDEFGMAKNVLETYGFLVREERAILEGLDAGDAATNDMLTAIIREQEKAIWMLNAMLQK